MKALNFGKTILETNSTFRNLFSQMHFDALYDILLNYIIIVPYKGEYIQVAGRLLNERFNMKRIGAGKKPDTVPERDNPNQRR